MIEVEQKFVVPDHQQTASRLAELGHDLGPTVRQVDRYFSHPSRDFGKTDEALRIRRIGNAVVITYKGPKLDGETKSREEIEIELPPGDESARQMIELLSALGFQPVGEVCKVRRCAEISNGGRYAQTGSDRVRVFYRGSMVEVFVKRLDDRCAAFRLH